MYACEPTRIPIAKTGDDRALELGEAVEGSVECRCTGGNHCVKEGAMKWRRALAHIHAIDFGVQIVPVLVGVLGVALWKVISR